MITLHALRHDAAEFDARWADVCARRIPGQGDAGAADTAEVEARVAEIIERIRREGDTALLDYARALDGYEGELEGLEVTLEERDAGARELDADAASSLRRMAKRVQQFHERQRDAGYSYADSVGGGTMQLGQRISPLRRAGLYVPGGRAIYPSSLLMNAIPARVAGVEQVIAVTPAAGALPPSVLYAAELGRVDRIFRVGGAHAVAALAHGTGLIPRVDKIVGPGNIYVATAKRQVFGRVDIDGFAGPSEVLIIGDHSADPRYVAADLMSQAEHDPRAYCVYVSESPEDIDAVAAALREAVAPPEPGIIVLALARDIAHTVALAEDFAAEHLQVMVENPDALLPDLRNAGTVFVGHHAPTALGDYMAGANHVLPTGGCARFGSPLGVYDFMKRSNVVRCDRDALGALRDDLCRLAEFEGLPLHARSVALRFDDPEDSA